MGHIRTIRPARHMVQQQHRQRRPSNAPDQHRRASIKPDGSCQLEYFPQSRCTKDLPALTTTAAFGGTGLLLTLALGGWMMVDNRRRDRRQGVSLKAQDIPTERLREGPASVDFRWCY